MTSSGWAEDTADAFEGFHKKKKNKEARYENKGFETRKNWFKESDSEGALWRREGVPFLGRLCVDFESTPQGNLYQCTNQVIFT